MKNKLLAFSAATVLLTGFSSCSKNESSTNQKIDIYLTDGPADFDAVKIEILAVDVKVDTSSEHRNDDHYGDNDDHRDDHLRRRDEYGVWQTVNFTPGVVDLLQLRNGIDSLIASVAVNGTVRKIRFTLGSNNTVVVNGVSQPLTLLNPTQNYLYVSLKERHRGRGTGGSLAVWVDFDLSRSIVLINGQYFLRPILRPFCNSNFGEIEGRVLPAAAEAIVRVYHGTDTASAIPNPDGFFKVRGLNQGDYTVLIDATAPYRDTTLLNVTVLTGRDTRIGTITLRQ
jgi:Domain of unknown function (DUF4382)